MHESKKYLDFVVGPGVLGCSLRPVVVVPCGVQEEVDASVPPHRYHLLGLVDVHVDTTVYLLRLTRHYNMQSMLNIKGSRGTSTYEV